MESVLSGLCGGGEWFVVVTGQGATAAAATATRTLNEAASAYAEARVAAAVLLLTTRASAAAAGGRVPPLPLVLAATCTPSARLARPSALAHMRAAAAAALATVDADADREAALYGALSRAVVTRKTLVDLLENHRTSPPRVAWPVLWSWPTSALGDPPVHAFDVHCADFAWDGALLRTHAAVQAMRTRQASAAAAHWRAALLEIALRYGPAARRGRALPGWFARLGEPELHPNAVLAMLHVCRAAAALEAATATAEDPLEALDALKPGNDTEILTGAWKAARLAALAYLGAVWPALAHLAAAHRHGVLVRRAQRTAHGAATEHSAGLRASLRAEIEAALARAQARVALVCGLLYSRTMGRHTAGTALLEYACERAAAAGGDTTPSAGVEGCPADAVGLLLGPYETAVTQGGGGGGGAILSMPARARLVRFAEQARSQSRAVALEVRGGGGSGGDDVKVLLAVALGAREYAMQACPEAAPDAVVMLSSLREL